MAGGDKADTQKRTCPMACMMVVDFCMVPMTLMVANCALSSNMVLPIMVFVVSSRSCILRERTRCLTMSVEEKQENEVIIQPA